MNRRELLKGAAVAAIGTAVVGPEMIRGFQSHRITNLAPPSDEAVTLGQLTRIEEDRRVATLILNSPEKRVFYIDVDRMPKAKAERHVREIMAECRSRMA